MGRQLAKLLHADIPTLAKALERKGRRGDTILAHINPQEAALLKARGGSGSTNPETGLLEFADDLDMFAPEPQATLPYSATQSYEGYGEQPPEGRGLKATQAAGSDLSITAPSNISDFGLKYVPGAQTYGLQASAADLGAPQLPGLAAAQSAVGPQLVESPAMQQAKELAKTTAEPKNLWEKLTGKLTTEQMARLGLAGGLGILGSVKARQAASQNAAATAEQKALAAPYQTQGTALVGAAQRGELTPQSAQAYQALQAQLRQGVETRGGVGAQQAQVQLEAFRNQLLQNQYTYGLQIAQLGDNIALGAIKTGLQLDQNLNTATQNFYTNLAAIAGGLPVARSAAA